MSYAQGKSWSVWCAIPFLEFKRILYHWTERPACPWRVIQIGLNNVSECWQISALPCDWWVILHLLWKGSPSGKLKGKWNTAPGYWWYKHMLPWWSVTLGFSPLWLPGILQWIIVTWVENIQFSVWTLILSSCACLPLSHVYLSW